MQKPYEPRQRVIAFREDRCSHATIGYHGRIVRIIRRSFEQNPWQPDLWIYRVYLNYFDAEFDIPTSQLLVTGEKDLSDPPSDTAYEVRFDSAPDSDNQKICGAYRLPDREWECFVFRKCEQPHRSYQLHLPMEVRIQKPITLEYNVPTIEVLDRDYVLRSVGEIIGVNEWQ